MPTKHYTIPIFLPELACPFRCVYCNQFSISGTVKQTSPEQMKKIIIEHLATFKKENRIVEIGFFGGNFTGIDLDVQKHYLEVAKHFIDSGDISSIRLSTRPDYIDVERLDFLKKYGVETIELGVQSLSDDILLKSGRGHSSADVFAASGLINSYGFKLGLQMMIGLPGDSLDLSINTAKGIIMCGAAETRIYPLLVIKGTELANLYNSGKYKPLSLTEAVQWTKEIYKIFDTAGIKMLRIGLHPSEELCNGNSLIAGPYHQSFKELVISDIWHDSFKQLVNKSMIGEIKIIVAPDQLNYAIGYSGKNREMLKKHFKKVEFCIDNNLKNRDFKTIQL